MRQRHLVPAISADFGIALSGIAVRRRCHCHSPQPRGRVIDEGYLSASASTAPAAALGPPYPPSQLRAVLAPTSGTIGRLRCRRRTVGHRRTTPPGPVPLDRGDRGREVRPALTARRIPACRRPARPAPSTRTAKSPRHGRSDQVLTGAVGVTRRDAPPRVDESRDVARDAILRSLRLPCAVVGIRTRRPVAIAVDDGSPAPRDDVLAWMCRPGAGRSRAPTPSRSSPRAGKRCRNSEPQGTSDGNSPTSDLSVRDMRTSVLATLLGPMSKRTQKKKRGPRACKRQPRPQGQPGRATVDLRQLEQPTPGKAPPVSPWRRSARPGERPANRARPDRSI